MNECQHNIRSQCWAQKCAPRCHYDLGEDCNQYKPPEQAVPTTYTVPFPLGATAYISSPYFCKEDKAMPCEVINYSISKLGILATCIVEGYGMIPCSADSMFATEKEGIEARETREKLYKNSLKTLCEKEDKP